MIPLQTLATKFGHTALLLLSLTLRRQLPQLLLLLLLLVLLVLLLVLPLRRQQRHGSLCPCTTQRCWVFIGW
jgi:hypothetical protein